MGTEFFEVNGIRVANIKNDSDIALFGIGILAGSNFETPEIAGISHFAEHMAFKGTEKRDWRQITREFAKLGVSNNAYTSNNEVFYHTNCPKSNIEPVIDLMLDMFFNSTIPEEELEKERGVITEEKKMYDDNPKFAFDAALSESFFAWDKGHTTIGTFDTISTIQRTDLIKFLESKINIGNVVFICAGDVPTEELKKYISKRVPNEHAYLAKGPRNEISDSFWSDVVKSPDKIKFTLERENITQSSIGMLSTGLTVEDTCYNDSVVLYKAIGGGMYSKLFTRIREELGLCYSTGMGNYAISYPNHIVSEIYGHLDPKNIDVFMEEAEKILDDVIKNGIDEDLFQCAKIDYLASVMRQTETSGGKAAYLLRRYLFGKKGGAEEKIAEINNVKIETCNALAEQLFGEQRYWGVMIPKGE